MIGVNSNVNALLIDIGNTSLKWAWLTEAGLSPVERVAHGEMDGRFPDTCWSDQTPSSQVLIANVASFELEELICEWIKNKWAIEPAVVRVTATALGVTNAYSDPRKLGIDRWLALIAIHQQMSGDVCIVDCGTAITIDVIDNQGRHQGGLILPGFNLMREALLDKTRIPWTELAQPEGFLGKDTAGCIASAALYSAVTLIDRVVVVTAQQRGVRPSLVLTGSDAGLLSGALDSPYEVIPDLVMRGLGCLVMGGGL